MGATMGPDVMQLHPEVEEILREVAEQPGSVLLRVPRGRELAALRADARVVSWSDSALSRAERHLVAVHREEVAFALRQAAWFRIAHGGFGRERVYKVITSDSFVPVPTGHTVRLGASTALSTEDVSTKRAGSLELLERLVADPQDSALHPESLLAAAQRLAPNVRARILAGTSFVIARRHQAAIVCFMDALRSSLPSEHRAIAWSNLAQALDECDRPDQALRASRRATDLLPGYIAAAAGNLWFAIRIRSKERVLDAVRALDAAGAVSPTSLDEVLQRFQECRVAGESSIAPDQQALVHGVRDAAHEPSRRLLDVLA